MNGAAAIVLLAVLAGTLLGYIDPASLCSKCRAGPFYPSKHNHEPLLQIAFLTADAIQVLTSL